MIYGEMIKNSIKDKNYYGVANLNLKKIRLYIETGLNDGGGLIHFHITTSDNRKICILIFKNAYFPHKKYKDKFRSQEEKEFDRLMREPVNINSLCNTTIVDAYRDMLAKKTIDQNCTNWEFLARYFFITNPDAQNGYNNKINENDFKNQPDYANGMYTANSNGSFS